MNFGRLNLSASLSARMTRFRHRQIFPAIRARRLYIWAISPRAGSCGPKCENGMPKPGCAGIAGDCGREAMSQMTSLAAIATPTSPLQAAAAMVARRGRARAQSRPKPTLEGGQPLFRAWPAFGVPRRRHLGGGEKGAEARSRCCSARSQTVGCTHLLAAFSGSMGRMTSARPAARQQRACGRAQPGQDEAGDGLRHSSHR